MAIFERRHYQAVAEVLREHRESSGAITYDDFIDEEKLIKSFATLFSRDNPNFSREGFLKACGMEDSL